MTVARQLLFPAGAEVLVARHWLDRLGLSSLEERLPAALSLGQQQRVALARALVRPAILLLLDEPLSALDAPLRRRLREELRQLQHIRKSSRPFHEEVSSSMIAALFLIETAKSELEEVGLPQAEAVSKASDILAETTQKNSC
jgi:ABC-type molybdate transport system ATPase subunit